MADRIEPDFNNPILSGITLPARARARRERKAGGRISAQEKSEWLEVIGELVARGVRRPTQLRRLTGLTFDTCKRYLSEVQMMAALQLDTVGELEARREKLYWEADAVAQEAFRRSFEEEHASARVGYLKIVLAANARKSSLLGLDSVNLNVESKTQIVASIDVVTDAAQRLDIPVEALASIGRETAQAISRQVIDVEAEETERENEK